VVEVRFARENVAFVLEAAKLSAIATDPTVWKTKELKKSYLGFCQREATRPFWSCAIRAPFTASSFLSING
jgi:hypothetical protein